MSEVYKVTFHRTYKVPIEKVYEYWENNLETNRELLTQSDIRNGAEAVATDWLVNGISDFLNSMEDSVEIVEEDENFLN